MYASHSYCQPHLFSSYTGIILCLAACVVIRVGGVPTSPTSFEGSVLQTCGGKLSETSQSQTQYDNGTVVNEMKIDHCV